MTTDQSTEQPTSQSLAQIGEQLAKLYIERHAINTSIEQLQEQMWAVAMAPYRQNHEQVAQSDNQPA